MNKNVQSLSYDICQFAKHLCTTYPSHPYKSFKPFCLIHSDICGPSHEKKIIGAHWCITFIDDHTCVCWVFFMKENFDICFIVPQFCRMVET